METEKSNLGKTIKKALPYILIVIVIVGFLGKRSSTSVEVRKIKIKDRAVKRSVSASGSVKSKNEADLSFPLVGVIRTINVSEGDNVVEGQLLVNLDTSTQYQTTLYYKDARDIEIRQRDLFIEEREANEDLLGGTDSYEIKLREYSEAVTQAEANYQASLATLGKYYIYAPFDGTVVEVALEESETVAAGTKVIRIADLDHMIFEIEVDQEDYGLLTIGQEVEIVVDAFPDFTFTGKINHLSLFADEDTDNFVIDINFESINGHELRLGLLGDAFMIMDKSDGEVPSITFNEISYDEDDNPFVWVLEGKKVRMLPLEIGLEGDVYTEVKTDLSDKVVVVPAREGLEIEDGFRAKLIN
ncbi:efflux RND transporter periplasmic adaptor subunit [Patescibacteria group bacterium]